MTNAAELALLVKVYDQASDALEHIDGKGKGLLGTLKALGPAVIGFATSFASWSILENAVEKTAQLGEQVHDLTMKTGLTDEAASHLIHAGEVTGVAYETISKGLGIFAKNLGAANSAAITESGKLSDAEARDADTIKSAQQRMADATTDAQRRMQDTTTDANREISRAFRDRTEAVKDANHEFINSMRDANRSVLDSQRDLGQAVKQGSRDLTTAQRDAARAQRDLEVAEKAAKKGSITDTEQVVRAQERLADAKRRVTEITEDNADRLSRAQERVQVAEQRRTEVSYQQTEKLKDINQRYADTVQTVNERVQRTARDTTDALARTYRDQQEIISKAGVKLTDVQDKSEIDTKAFGIAIADIKIYMKDVTDASGRLTEEGFDKLADSIAKMPASLTRTKDVMAIFGKGGAALEPLFALGAKGLHETALQADKLGLTLSAANVEKIHDYAVAHRTMNEAIKGVQVEIGLYLMPRLTEFANWFVEHQPEIRAFIHDAIEFAEEKFRELEPEIRRNIETFSKFVAFLRDHQREVISILVGLTVYFVAMWVAANPAIVIIPALVLFITHLDDVKKAVTDAFNSVKNAVVGAANSVIDWVRGHWVAIASLLTGPFGTAAIQIIKHWDEIRAGANAAMQFFESIPGRILGFASDAANAAYGVGKAILNGILDGIKSAPNALKDALTSLLPGALKSGASKVFDALGSVGIHAAGVRYVMQDELAIIHKGETVRNAGETRGAAGGLSGGITVQFNGPVTISGGNAQAVAASVGIALQSELRSRGFAI